MVDLGVPVGPEPSGRRPAVVIGSTLHCSFPIAMALIAPCTTVDRGLPHHVAIDWQAVGLDRPTWVRTEDIRSISERRFVRRGPLGYLTPTDLTQIRHFITLMTTD